MKLNTILLFLFLSTSVFSQKTVLALGAINERGYLIDVETVMIKMIFDYIIKYRFQTIRTGGYYGDYNKNYEWRIDDIDLLNLFLIPSLRFSSSYFKRE